MRSLITDIKVRPTIIDEARNMEERGMTYEYLRHQQGLQGVDLDSQGGLCVVPQVAGEGRQG
jgi:hypothetical protein